MAFILFSMSVNDVTAQTAQGEYSPAELHLTAFVGDTVYSYFDVVNTGTVAFYPLAAFRSDYGFIWVDDSGLPDYIQPGTSGRVIVSYTPTLPGTHTAYYSMKIGNQYPGIHMTGTAYLRGDVNLDNSLDITDITSLIAQVLEQQEMTATSDVNRDGNVNVTDLVFLISYLLNDEWPTVDPVPDVFQDEIIDVNGVQFKMIAVEGGTFNMGGDYIESVMYHQVTLSNFHIAETEVTQDLWDIVMHDNPSVGNGGQACPVDNVSWTDCQEFISRLNQLTGRNFRLPTEAEWEFAARGGNKTHGYTYSGSNNINDVGWSEDNSGDRTHVVATKQANELGIYDMSGNVWEWCQDWYAPYPEQAQVNPQGPETGTERIVRGGCMWGHTRFCTVFYRMCYPPEFYRGDVGLRLAL